MSGGSGDGIRGDTTLATEERMTTWDLTGTRQLVLICNGDSCSDRDADGVTLALRRALRECQLDPRVHTARTRCLGRCDDGCTVVVQPDGTWYRAVTPAIAVRIVHEHLAAGQAVAAHASYVQGEDGMEQVGGVVGGKPKPT